MKRFLVGMFMGLIGVFVYCNAGYSAMIYVPDDYTTIQGAIDAASSGDTIIVGPGTYYETIDTTGKSLTIQSSDGAESTIIDGSLYGSPDGFDDFYLGEDDYQSIDVGTYCTPTFNDVDEDGDMDLVSGDYYGEIYYFENDGSGNFTSSSSYFGSIDVGDYSIPTFADIDGDGDEDLFIGERGGNINYYEKVSGSFTLITETWQSIDIGHYSVPSFCDMDGDGDLDLLIGEYDGNFNLYENNGMGSFSLITEEFESIDLGSSVIVRLAFSDLDHDGDLDLLIGQLGGDGFISFYENVSDIDGDGFYNYDLIDEFFQMIYYYMCLYGMTFYDYDDDDDDDLFIGTCNGTIDLYENLGDIREYKSVVTLSSSTIDGFTIQNGYDSKGGGIYCTGFAIIRNCILEDNNALYGGGIYSNTDCVIIEKNIIQDNTVVIGAAERQKYGGICISSDNNGAIVRYNSIMNNDGYNYGGGVAVLGGNTIIKNNIVYNNVADRSHVATGVGGGISGGTYTENNIVANNGSHASAGGVGGETIRNNIVIDNTCGYYGGGAVLSSSDNFYNNIMVSNSAGSQGSGIFVVGDLPSVLVNNILAYNINSEALYSRYGDSTLSNDYNDYHSNSVGNYYGVTAGSNEIYDNPLFITFTDDSDWTNDDFSLQSESTCIDSGDPGFEYRDPDGSRADMGAYGGDCADEWDLDGDGYIGGPWGDDTDDMDDTVPGTLHPKVLHYNFDDLYVFDSAGKIVDESIYSNIGDYSGCVSTDGIFSEAMEFDGADYVEVPDSDSLDLTGALTVSAWIYPTNLSATGRQWIIRKPNSWGVFLQNGWIYFYTDTRDNGGTWMSAAWRVPEDQWSHIAGVYDSSTGVMNFYINGRLVTTRTQSMELNANDYSIYMGAGNSTPVEGFYGIIDELKIYSDALPEDEVNEDIMDGGRGFKVLDFNFDDGTATDQSGCRNNGTVSGATTDTGIDGSSLLFNGSSSYVSIPDSGTLDITDELTVEAWVYPTSISGARQMIVDKGSWGLFVQNGWIFFYTRNSSGTWISAAWVVTEDVWNHVAGTYDSSTSTMNFYINGELATSRTQSGELRLTDTNLYIGSNSSTPTQVFQGKIDEVRIYNIALTEDMIEYDMKESIPEDVLYYNFDDGTATDQSNCENDGTISGAVSSTVDGRTGLSFDGSDYVSVEDAVSLDVTEAVTVEAWIYPTNISSSTRQVIINKQGAYGIFIQSGWIYFYTDTRNDGGIWMSAAWVVPEDTWSHVAGVYDERTGTMTFYINGDSVTTRTQSVDVNVNNNDLFIGSADTSGSQPFYGYIDDVRVYNTALSEGEIEDDVGL